jgi:hypothetical protein
MTNNKSDNLAEADLIDRTIDNAGNFTKLCMVLEIIKSNSQEFLELRSKNQELSQKYVELLDKRFKQLRSLIDKIVSG